MIKPKISQIRYCMQTSGLAWISEHTNKPGILWSVGQDDIYIEKTTRAHVTITYPRTSFELRFIQSSQLFRWPIKVSSKWLKVTNFQWKRRPLSDHFRAKGWLVPKRKYYFYQKYIYTFQMSQLLTPSIFGELGSFLVHNIFVV